MKSSPLLLSHLPAFGMAALAFTACSRPTMPASPQAGPPPTPSEGMPLPAIASPPAGEPILYLREAKWIASERGLTSLDRATPVVRVANNRYRTAAGIVFTAQPYEVTDDPEIVRALRKSVAEDSAEERESKRPQRDDRPALNVPSLNPRPTLSPAH